MSECTKRKPRVKPPRFVSLYPGPTEQHPSILEIVEWLNHAGTRVMTTRYWLFSLRADFGKGCRLEKFACDEGSDAEEKEYAVNRNGTASTCSCKGFDSHGVCKHLQGMQALEDRGQWPDSVSCVDWTPLVEAARRREGGAA